MTTTTVTRQDNDRSVTNRSIQTIFILEDTRGQDEDGRPRYVFLALDTYHDKDRKHYRTAITRQYRDGIVNRWAMSLDMYKDRSPVADRTVAVARHSVKALRDAHEWAVESLTAPDTFPALLEWAARAETRG